MAQIKQDQRIICLIYHAFKNKEIRSYGGPLEGEGRHLSMRHGSKLKNAKPSKTQTERIFLTRAATPCLMLLLPPILSYCLKADRNHIT